MSIFLPKVATEDTVIEYRTWDEQGKVQMRSHPVKKGSRIVIDTPAAQRNPFHWPDPLKFDPSRHLPGNKQIFAGFSLGQRRCIGQKYAEVELVAFLSLMVKNFKIQAVPAFPGESTDSMLKRMLQASEGMTLTPVGWPLALERRH
jgi:cytochrome P450